MKIIIKIKSLAVALMLLFSLTSNSYAGLFKPLLLEIEKDFDNSEDKSTRINPTPYVKNLLEERKQYLLKEINAISFEKQI